MAKYVYPAVFTHEAEGGYSITFPDLPDCATSAETLEEGIEMAADALCLILYDMGGGRSRPPEPSDGREYRLRRKPVGDANPLRHHRISEVLTTRAVKRL